MTEENSQEINEHKRLGHQFIIAMWILAMVLIYFIFNNIINRDHNPNQDVVFSESPNGSKVVTLQRNRAGHYVTSGRINNQPVTFILDTGATDIAIPQNIARALKLRRGAESYYQTANGTALGYQTMLDSVSVGNIRLHHIPASIVTNMDDSEILLGMSFLKHIEFSQRGDTLILQQ